MVATFSHAFSNVTARSPDRCAFLRPPDRNLTFAGLYCLVEATAHWLLNSGVGHGDVVFLVFPNIVEFVVMLLAVMRCRAIAVPIPRSCTSDYFESCLSNYRPKLLLLGPDGEATKEAAAAVHRVSKAVASVQYDPSDSVHTTAFVHLKLEREDLTPLVPATISGLVNEGRDVALFLPPVDDGPRVPVTQEGLVASIGNLDLARIRFPSLFPEHSLVSELVYSLSDALHEVDAGDKIVIEHALKLNEHALSTSTSFMVAGGILLANKNQGLIQNSMWVGTTVLLFFASFVLSLAGVQYHPILGRSSVYVGQVALFAAFSGVATTVISALPEMQNQVASALASVYVGLLTILIIIYGGAWQPHPRGRIREVAAEMAAAAAATATSAAATPASSTGAETV